MASKIEVDELPAALCRHALASRVKLQPNPV